MHAVASQQFVEHAVKWLAWISRIHGVPFMRRRRIIIEYLFLNCPRDSRCILHGSFRTCARSGSGLPERREDRQQGRCCVRMS